MSIVDQKKQIFGNIAALKTLTQGIPNLKRGNSIPSINNAGNALAFLSDFVKSLVGYLPLIEEVVNILTNILTTVEKEIKILLKQELKNIVSCGVNPSLPAFMKSTGTGIVIEVKKIDFFDMLLIDANSVGGKLMYNDVTPVLTDSEDFNTFLYGVLQDDGVTHTWKNIFDITFHSTAIGLPNNTITIKATSNYNTKTLTDLNNDFIDSLTLFNTENLVNRVIDSIFGSISFTVGKTKKQIENEEKINTIIEKMCDSDNAEAEPDSSFTFSNDEVYQHQERADFRQKGILKLECCNKVLSSVPTQMLTDFNTDMSGATSTLEKREAVSNNLNKMANQSAANSKNTEDDITIKVGFIQNIINNLVKSIVGVILSPKVITIFIVNFKIIYGSNATWDDPVDFMKKNKVLFKTIIKKVSEIIIKKLLVIALKAIATYVAAAIAKKQIEKQKAKSSQVASLVGVPQEVLRKMKGYV